MAVSFDMENEILENNTFRKVLYESDVMKIAVMRLGPGEFIQWEIHEDVDQFTRIESGECEVYFRNTGTRLSTFGNDSIVIPRLTQHLILNKSEHEDLLLYSVYTGNMEEIEGNLIENEYKSKYIKIRKNGINETIDLTQLTDIAIDYWLKILNNEGYVQNNYNYSLVYEHKNYTLTDNIVNFIDLLIF